MPTPPRKPVLPNIALACLLLVAVYVLSYAPVARLLVGTELSDALNRRGEWWLDAYKPALMLMQTSPLRMPLLSWADKWGVRDAAEFHAWFAAGHPRSPKPRRLID